MDTVTMRVGTTEVVVENVVTAEDVDSAPVLRLRLKKPGPDRQVAWREGTVDNEKMGKKKSKCCCIYKKPVNFGESSSSDEEECEHCFGHPEKRRKNIEKHNSSKEPEQIASQGKNYHDHDEGSENVAASSLIPVPVAVSSTVPKK
ncbi:PREDICTED: protein phosphatase 1 regulatory subunit 11 isoform X1 [Rhagoletis zephyria]|uniref:protein phosphatase 1 regulatory subunit 11 isoform X1 n=1 Tax=Rhagoletis zephyria TaxID=28612 RepID=UPI000811222A|nr:PREDICTED: protein phosphatase 1 regulatory subunit 11 isoform X1 [Rhagoletis zephyria]